jgi:hypothetical protein
VSEKDGKAQPYPPPQPTEADGPPAPAPPPESTLDNTPEIDPLTGEVSPSSGLHRKYEVAKPSPES